MIQMIKDCKELTPYICKEIRDQGIEVGIDDSLEAEQIVIVKVDDYYNGLNMANPPKSIDYCVLVDCECNSYALYLLELKNVNSPGKLVIKDIQEKFEVTINDFLSNRFKAIFLADQYKYRGIKLYLVSDAYGLKGKYGSYEEYKKVQEKIQSARGRDSLRVDFNLSSKLYKFKGKILRINYDIPPNPVIQRIL